MSDTDEAARRGLSKPHAFKKRSVIVIIMEVVMLVLLMLFMLLVLVVVMVAFVGEVILIFMLHAPMGSHGSARTCQA